MWLAELPGLHFVLVVVISPILHFHCSHLSPIHLSEAVPSVSVARATFICLLSFLGHSSYVFSRSHIT